MKKNYIEPEICLLQIDGIMPIATSGVESNNGIGFGGIDNSGIAADSPFCRKYSR